jgi:hypothetical protein
MNFVYDYIIIGSGIAGLYSAYKIINTNPNASILILERNKREWLGGRTYNENFFGVSIATGAGIGRQKKDTLLLKLLNNLHISHDKRIIHKNYANNVLDVNIDKNFSFYKKEYNKNPSLYKNKTFSQFAIELSGKENYNNFKIASGYSDYENSDVFVVLYYYGMDDNFNKLNAFMLSWKDLVDTLINRLLEYNVNIKASSNVIQLNKLHDTTRECGFVVKCDNNKTYMCNKLIIATTISSIQKLLPVNQFTIYKEIHGQPFLRVYGKFSGRSAYIMKNAVKSYTIVSGPLYKIIPIDTNKGVYMIAYNDNHGSIILKNNLKNTLENRKLFAKLLESALGLPNDSLKLDAIKDFYWNIGTHYYEPLSDNYKNRSDFIEKAQNPMKNIKVVGEVVAFDQGWVEGALESVELAVTKKWILEK